jgi:multiple sugar transport system permease protein
VRYGLLVVSFMSPWIVGFLAFFLYPMLTSLYFSFTHYDLLSEPRWIGLDNYRYLFTTDPSFWPAVRNTLWLIVVGLPIRLAWAIATAMLLTLKARGMRTYRTLYFLPSMVPPVAAALTFTFLLNPELGPVNRVLGAFGIPQPLWFLDPAWSKPALVILALWGVGDAMIVFLAGLLDVPQTLYEAARIDGAGPVARFRHITLPMISPVIFFSLVVGLINGFQAFTEAYVAGNTSSGQTDNLGEPQGSLLLYALYLYKQAFRSLNMGYASAMAWVLFAATMLCTILLMKTSDRWVHGQGGLR